MESQARNKMPAARAELAKWVKEGKWEVSRICRREKRRESRGPLDCPYRDQEERAPSPSPSTERMLPHMAQYATQLGRIEEGVSDPRLHSQKDVDRGRGGPSHEATQKSTAEKRSRSQENSALEVGHEFSDRRVWRKVGARRLQKENSARENGQDTPCGRV